jgi:hypothetical protein
MKTGKNYPNLKSVAANQGREALGRGMTYPVDVL